MQEREAKLAAIIDDSNDTCAPDVEGAAAEDPSSNGYQTDVQDCMPSDGEESSAEGSEESDMDDEEEDDQLDPNTHYDPVITL